MRSALDELDRPLSEVFNLSMGFVSPTDKELSELARRLSTFEQTAKEKVVARLIWAREEREDEKAGLMLRAASYFSRTSPNCPVCTQDLTPVPHIKQELERLSEYAHEEHLRKDIEDLCRSLVEELGNIIETPRRNDSKQTLSARILSDWQVLKKTRFGGLLPPIGERYDQRIQRLAAEFEQDQVKRPPLAEGFLTEFPNAFVNLDTALDDAWAYISLCRCVLSNRSQISRRLSVLLLAQGGEDESLSEAIAKGRTLSDDVQVLEKVRDIARNLFQSVKTELAHQSAVVDDRNLANATDAIKDLRKGVQGEIVTMVQHVEAEMKACFNLLYDKEVLEFDSFTTGHPGNRDIKDEVNLYLRAGDQRIPFGPFCNAGRMRALTLSFVFALLKKSPGALGVLVLDDPAISLDDEHKTRFVDRVIEPLLGEKQIVLATHYERFYKRAENAFADAERLTMTPRREPWQAVGFEPGDLLQRVERALGEPSCSWRDAAADLRRWLERTLSTLSSYCPAPFAIYEDNLPACIRAYREIKDPRIATNARTRILSVLTEGFVRRVHVISDNHSYRSTTIRITGCG